MASESDDVLSTKPDALGSLSLVEGPDGRKIAYDQQDGSSPGVVYIHGLHSNMDEPPSAALSKYCREKDISYLRFDLSGHGQSSGRLEDATITQWLEDVELVLNSLRSGPLVLVGNALGAWLMFLYTMRNPDRVFGLVGLATAADFTHLLWKNLDKTTKDEIKRLGYYTLKSDGDDGPSVKLSLDLIMDGEKHTILDMPGKLGRESDCYCSSCAVFKMLIDLC